MALIYEFLDFFFDIYFSIRSILRGTYTEQILSNAWALFVELWPYVLLGAFAAVIIAQTMSNNRIRQFLTRRGGLPILVASVLGVFSPMCTFAAIPLAGGLLAAGVPLPPLMAFMIASPLINPSLFIITWGVMGPEMAIARTLSAFFLGITGGWLTELALTRNWNGFTEPLRSGFTVQAALPGCSFDGGAPTLQSRILSFVRHSAKMTFFISKYFILALILAGVVQALIKPQWIAALLGGGGFKSVLLGGLLGIPLYVCGGGTAALIGVLVSMGMGQGAALAFFITGPATKISTILSLNAVLRKRVAAVYLVVTLLGGVLIGWGYSYIAPELKIDPAFYGQIESKEDAVNYKPGIGSPQGE
ncbi:MAG: permease [Candidatus Latescibacterota bacterium]